MHGRFSRWRCDLSQRLLLIYNYIVWTIYAGGD